MAPWSRAWSADADGRFRSHSGACPPCCVRLRRCRCGVVQGRGPNRNRGQAVTCRTLHVTDSLREVIRHIKTPPPLDNPPRCGLPVMNRRKGELRLPRRRSSRYRFGVSMLCTFHIIPVRPFWAIGIEGGTGSGGWGACQWRLRSVDVVHPGTSTW